MNNITIFTLFLIFSLVLTQTTPPVSFCLQNSDCNSYLTNNTQFCFQGTCNPFVTFTGTGLLINPANQSCSSTALFSSNIPQSCITLSAPTCAITTFQQCINSTSTVVGSATICQANTPPIIKGNTQTCNVTTFCDQHLYCDQQICRPALGPGSPCFTGGIPCSAGLNCDSGYCTTLYSLPTYAYCSVSTSCSSNLCQLGRCMPIISVPCYSNSDCIATPKIQTTYCSSNDTKFLNPGACVSDASIGVYTPYYQCLASNCATAYNQSYINCLISKCLPQYVKATCASYCPLRPDQRYAISLGDNIFDCKALTAVKMSPSSCPISQQFLNCIVAAGFVNHLSFIVIFASILVLLL